MTKHPTCTFSGACDLSQGLPGHPEGLGLVSDQPLRAIGGRHYLLAGEVHTVLGAHHRRDAYRGRETELVARLYEEHGQGFVRILDGDFVVLVFDGPAGELGIYNSRYQATRLYYSCDGTRLAFASSVALLLGRLPAAPRLRRAAAAAFLDTGFSKTEQTPIAGVCRLLPTASVHVRGREVTVRHHWHDEYRFDRRPVRDLGRKLAEYEALFRGGIARFLDATRPTEVGCLLSGGHDTSYTLIQTSRALRRPVHAFTASFEGYPFDETPKARRVAHLCGAIHHRVRLGPGALDLVPRLVRAVEEPVSGGSLPIYACMAEAARHVDVVLAGDAGDTLWGEYYPVAEWHRYLRHLPHRARAALHALNKTALRVVDWERLWESEHVLSLFAKEEMYRDFFGRLCTYRHFNRAELSRCLAPGYVADGGRERCLIDLPFDAQNFADALVEAKMLHGVYLYMVPPTQRSAEALGMRFFSPYNNIRLINFIGALPHDWLNSGNTLRRLTNRAHQRRFHKLALARYLPDAFIKTIQQSLDVPFHALFCGRDPVLDALLTRLKRRPWFRADYLDRLFEEFPRQRVKPGELCELKHHGYRIYALLTFEVWCMQFVDGLDRDVDLPLEQYLAP